MQALDDLDPDHAASVSEQAVQLMTKLSVPLIPPNFDVWFAYVLGRSAALRKTIDILRSNKRVFDKAVNRELYGTFFRSNHQTSAEQSISEELRVLLGNVKDDLSGAAADSAAQALELSKVESALLTTRDAHGVLGRLAEELSKVTRRASSLEARLADASGEVQKLRASLEEAELRSRTDALTGLANRRALEMFVRSAQIRAMEQGDALSTFMVDVDHFKKFNDKYGHQLGDQVLRVVAKCLQEGIRDGDLAARYGGEELMCVLPGADLDAGRQIAERIRCHIANARVTKRATGEQVGPVTISIGVAQFQPGESFDSLVERCDKALYEAKQAGRNCIMAA